MLFTKLKPMLLYMGKEIIEDNDWEYQIKWDGWRILLHKEGDRIEAYTRTGNNITSKFPELQDVCKSIKSYSAILDCEGVVLRNGYSKFKDFAYRGRLTNKAKIEEATKTHPVTFVAFDILFANKPLIKEPLIERKKHLAAAVEPSNSIVITPSVEREGNYLFQFTKENNMEGIVGKRLSSTYQINQRSYDWLKFKHFKLTNMIIIGYKEKPFTMLVGYYSESGRIKAVASVEFGFKTEEKQAFREISKGIIKKVEKGIYWLEPLLCCTIQYLERTENGMLRITSFKGFNFLIEPKSCLP